MKKNVYLFFIVNTLFLTSCKSPYKSEVYELDYDQCKTIKSDKSHHLWQEKEWVQELTLATCEQIIFDAETPDVN